MTDRERLLAALEQFDVLMEKIGGCTDGGCVIFKPKGMHTNGGCRCYRDPLTMQRYVHATNQLRAAIRAAAALTSQEPQ